VRAPEFDERHGHRWVARPQAPAPDRQGLDKQRGRRRRVTSIPHHDAEVSEGLGHPHIVVAV